jgi:hypothetical protein
LWVLLFRLEVEECTNLFLRSGYLALLVVAGALLYPVWLGSSEAIFVCILLSRFVGLLVLVLFLLGVQFVEVVGFGLWRYYRQC